MHLLEGHEGDLLAAAFTPDGLRAVTASTDHEMRLWHVADGTLLRIMTGHSHKVSGLAVAANGLIASGDGAGEIRLWDGQTGAFLKTLARQATSVASLSFSPDGKLLLSELGSTAMRPRFVTFSTSIRGKRLFPTNTTIPFLLH